MVDMPKEVVDALQDPETIKALTTTDKEGCPHTVYKFSITVMEDGGIGYVEMIERSRTYKNMLHNHWDKKNVAISIFNPKSGLAYQIKGIPTHCLTEGAIWDKFRDECWKQMPDAEPAAVWLIEPDEIMDESYEGRLKEESKRIPQYLYWNTHQRRKKK